ncbi:hypothetical protein MS3_00008921 [Schistosoma haematobium]|uniref:Uncharacterized protein n=1 Tax=Schistosoma haematobium TaxID=6185 RepID=A0A922II49_SCHHA|nr:hypothetical protein MS3_00008920 [Schistosoma haematobium]XP_051064639.1 hypothetical protein MS3_00008921 [Schistosoma haematobium]KAH9580207.1 hypothetical protein MS3_00008920 [Schistosoma haematobium]KAH9580209.1 hypothetical protein MS3_00008921 [Schistosoma haematobium]
MATVANQPDCEVDKTSLVVLFSPIFFLDRSTTIPISLANPLPIHVLNLCVKLARDELKTNLSVTKLFQVPSLFLHDCTRTLILHQKGFVENLEFFTDLNHESVEARPSIDGNNACCTTPSERRYLIH